MPPQFLVIGHIVQDLAPNERAAAPTWRLGGTASYAALLAIRLGLDTAVLTAAAADLALEDALPGADIVRIPSTHSTQIRNLYTAAGRVQYVPQRAATIDRRSLPADWRRPDIVLVGPVAGEVDEALTACFPQALVGISAQGWLRNIGLDGRVRPRPPQRWRAETVLGPAHVLFVSEEDISPSRRSRAFLARWSRQVEVLSFTQGERGAEVCHRGAWRHVDAFPAQVVDPTGAGDIFAAAFLIRYRETGDPWEAARFASGGAAFVVECEGLANIPDRTMIEARLRAHPDIVAR
jgi:sugar/nucleoside kinase (ribokinase family)